MFNEYTYTTTTTTKSLPILKIDKVFEDDVVVDTKRYHQVVFQIASLNRAIEPTEFNKLTSMGLFGDEMGVPVWLKPSIVIDDNNQYFVIEYTVMIEKKETIEDLKTDIKGYREIISKIGKESDQWKHEYQILKEVFDMELAKYESNSKELTKKFNDLNEKMQEDKQYIKFMEERIKLFIKDFGKKQFSCS